MCARARWRGPCPSEAQERDVPGGHNRSTPHRCVCSLLRWGRRKHICKHQLDKQQSTGENGLPVGPPPAPRTGNKLSPGVTKPHQRDVAHADGRPSPKPILCGGPWARRRSPLQMRGVSHSGAQQARPQETRRPARGPCPLEDHFSQAALAPHAQPETDLGHATGPPWLAGGWRRRSCSRWLLLGCGTTGEDALFPGSQCQHTQMNSREHAEDQQREEASLRQGRSQRQVAFQRGGAQGKSRWAAATVAAGSGSGKVAP